MTATAPSAPQIAQALVNFSLHRAFPEEDAISQLPITPDTLPTAIQALAESKAQLQAEIHAINEETADDVRAWQASAQAVQDDILRSKALAADIIKAAEAPEASGKEVEELEARAEFLIRELNYNAQVVEALRGIRGVNRTLDEVERAKDERRILDALHLLERSWKELDAVGVSRSCRAVRLLDVRAFELKSDVHEVFDKVWNVLVRVDVENHQVCIGNGSELQDEPMSLEDAVVGLKAYKEVSQRMDKFWQDLNRAILLPRMDITKAKLPGIRIEGNTLGLKGSADKLVHSLFTDLEKVFSFLVQHLPPDLVDTISSTLLPDTIHKITTVWLDAAVPSSLHELDQFQETINTAREFCDKLKQLGFTNLGGLQEWTENVPKVWLSKCREAALDSVRTKLSQGLGDPKRVEKVEKQMVSKEEGQKLVANVAADSVDDQGWNAWIDDDEVAPEAPEPEKPASKDTAKPQEDDDDGVDAWGWGDDGGPEEETAETKNAKEDTKKEPKETKEEKPPDDDEEDPAAAWGWGDDANDEEATEEPQAKPNKAEPTQQPQTRELVLKETYSISSLPQPILDLITAIVEDGAALTDPRYAETPIASQAAGLFGLPTLALAMFRAIAPHYYSPGIGGNMFLYNDSSYLAEQLTSFSSAWKDREDISPRAKTMLRLDNDIKSLQNFANRAYTNELSIQKTVLRDLLGGEQSLLHQADTAASVSAATSRVRALATAWEDILARSVWQQAVGALVDAIASKIISDVMDLPSIGQEEAYNTAKLISSVEELDDLFLPSRLQGKPREPDEVPLTAQFAAHWLRLKYLSEVLQSNLKDVRFLWMEGELSLYFTVEEVVDLIHASFEDNPRTREVVREIRANPAPLGEGSG